MFFKCLSVCLFLAFKQIYIYIFSFWLLFVLAEFFWPRKGQEMKAVEQVVGVESFQMELV